ncbi:MAG: BlaI/MecI/CopY family transcriptional regulator [Saprospiraceae bacterium]|nr:BlaI/MecI/CopY family transcriptional regulator [Saprospiraceae bacterium]
MKRLNHKEEEVMTILWRLEKAFVNDILDQMEEPKPPYNTVSSLVRKLVTEGHVGYEAFGKTHRYFPILKKEDYRANAFRRFMDNYFGGSPSALLSYFMEEEKLKPEELDKLMDQIKKRDE